MDGMLSGFKCRQKIKQLKALAVPDHKALDKDLSKVHLEAGK